MYIGGLHVKCRLLQQNFEKYSNTKFHENTYSGGGGTAVAQGLRCCATNRKVGGSILAGVNGIFH